MHIHEDLMRQDFMVKIELEEDIYCIGFLVFLRSESSKLQGKVVLKAVFALIF